MLSVLHLQSGHRENFANADFCSPGNIAFVVQDFSDAIYIILECMYVQCFAQVYCEIFKWINI